MDMKILLVGIAACISSYAISQYPADFRSEQVFITPRHSTVRPGDTISVDGIVTCLAENGSKPYSRYVYVELIGDADSAIVRGKAPCDESGRFSIGIPTDRIDAAGVYYLRAYTTFMRNFRPECFAVHPVLIGQSLPTDDGIADESMSLTAFPAGGFLSPGKPQTVSALLQNGQGFPLVSRRLNVIDNHGDTIATGITSPSGIAVMTFIPTADNVYKMVFQEMGIEKKEMLPISPTGKKVEAVLSGNRIIFDIYGDIQDCRLIVYERKNGLSEATLTDHKGCLSLPKAPELATLFLTDGNLNIIAETTIAKLSEQNSTAFPQIKLSTNPEKDINISGFMADSIKLVSARILEYDNFIAENAESALEYKSDFSSPMPFPARFAASDERTRIIDLNAWLSTVKFKRFALRDVMNAPDVSVYTYLPERSMQIKGRVWRGPKQPFKGGRLVAYNEDNSAVYDTVITRDGYFSIDVDDFQDGTSFFLQPINTKEKPEKGDVKIEDYTFPPVVLNRRPLQKYRRYINADVSIDKSSSLNFRELANVTVKARVTSEPISSKKFYATRYKDREEIERKGYLTLRDIIEDMAFVVVEGGHGQPAAILSTRGSFSLNSGAPLKVLWDGSEIDANILGVLIDQSSQDIESVEQLSVAEALAYVPFSMTGAISITTRKGGPRKYNVVSKGTIVTPMGLTHATQEPMGKIQVPNKPGKYRLALDYLSQDGKIHSVEYPFEVDKH